MLGRNHCINLDDIRLTVNAWADKVGETSFWVGEVPHGVRNVLARRIARMSGAKGWGFWAFPCLVVGLLGITNFLVWLVAASTVVVPFVILEGLVNKSACIARRCSAVTGKYLTPGLLLAAAVLKLIKLSVFKLIAMLVSIICLRAVFAELEESARLLWTLYPELAPRYAQALGLNLFCFQRTENRAHVGDGLDRLRALGYEDPENKCLAALATQPSGLWAALALGVSPWESPFQRTERLLSMTFMGMTINERRWLGWISSVGESSAMSKALDEKKANTLSAVQSIRRL